MNTDHLKYLVKLGDLKSINKVAAQLFRSRSSIISAMNKLEEEIGIGLFKRDLHGVSLTEHGARVCREAQQILQIIDSWKNPAALAQKQKIIISTLPSIAETHVPLLYSELYNIFENYIFEYEIIYNDINNMINIALSNNSDYTNIVLGGYFDFEKDNYQRLISNSRCKSVPLFTSDHALLYNKDTDIKIDDNVLLKEIVKQDVKFAVFKNAELSPIFYFFDKKRKAIYVPSLHHVLSLIDKNRNIMGVYTSFLIKPGLNAYPNICSAKCLDYANKLNFCMIYSASLDEDKAILEIINFIKEFFDKHS